MEINTVLINYGFFNFSLKFVEYSGNFIVVYSGEYL